MEKRKAKKEERKKRREEEEKRSTEEEKKRRREEAKKRRREGRAEHPFAKPTIYKNSRSSAPVAAVMLSSK